MTLFAPIWGMPSRPGFTHMVAFAARAPSKLEPYVNGSTCAITSISCHRGLSANRNICAKGVVNAKRAFCANGGILGLRPFRHVPERRPAQGLPAVALPRLQRRGSAQPANEEPDEAQDRNDVTSWLQERPGAWAGLPAPAADLGDVNGAASGLMRKWNYLQQSTNGSICDRGRAAEPWPAPGEGRPGPRQVWC
jgi:hypothetical protein